MATSVSDSYTIPGALNFKRLRNQGQSTTIETKSAPGQPSRLMEQMRRFRCIENFIKHKLYHKYASSQNYYYLKDVNSILNEERNLAVIEYKDGLSMQTREEQLKKYYKSKDYKAQISKLTEYYKYHKEIPRIFAKEVYDTFFDHHDQKRKAEFIVITKKLREEAGEDVKAELEQALKKLRDSKYQPLLADLKPFVATGYKTKQMNEPRNTQSNHHSQSGYSLQQKLNNIFIQQTDMSMSQFSIKSVTEEADVLFSKHLRSSLGAKDIPAPIPASFSFKKQMTSNKLPVKASVIVDVRAEAEYNPPAAKMSPSKIAARISGKITDERSGKVIGSSGNSKTTSREPSRQGSISQAVGKTSQQGLTSVRQLSIGQLQNPSTGGNQSTSTAKFVNSVIRASLSPEIVASLKKIQLPAEENSKQKGGQSNQHMNSGHRSPGITIKPVGQMRDGVVSTGVSNEQQDSRGVKGYASHSRTSSQVSKVLGEGSQVLSAALAYVRKPTSTSSTQLALSTANPGHSRGLALVKNNEEMTEPLSSLRNSGGFRREASDFRITKKPSMEDIKVSQGSKGLNSKRSTNQAYLFSEKDHVIGIGDDNISSPLISQDLIGSASHKILSGKSPALNKLNFDGKVGESHHTVVSKHQKQNSLNGPNLYSSRRVVPPNNKIVKSNFDIAGSNYGSSSTIQKGSTQVISLSNRQMSNPSNSDAMNFKMNIDKLIRASGALDLKSVGHGGGSGLNIGSVHNMLGAGQPMYQRSQTNSYQNFLHPSIGEMSSASAAKHKHSKSQPLGSSRENSAAVSTSRLVSQVLMVKPSPALHKFSHLMGTEFSSSGGNKEGVENKSGARGLSSANKVALADGEYSAAKFNVSKGSMIWPGAGEDNNQRKRQLFGNGNINQMALEQNGGGIATKNRSTVSKQPFDKKRSVAEYTGLTRSGMSSGSGTVRASGGFLGSLGTEDRPAYAKKEIKLVKKGSHQKTGSTNF
jgi:hypothetical protein